MKRPAINVLNVVILTNTMAPTLTKVNMYIPTSLR